MEGQEYLNQISTKNRPAEKTMGGKILSSKFFWVGAIGLVALIVVLIIGAILGSNKGGEKNLSYALKLHLDNTSAVISAYQPSVKSSNLRASSASLYSVLSNTNKELTDYITTKYGFNEKEISANLISEAQLNSDELKADLSNAKINGILDRIYAHKIAYEISLIMNEEVKIFNSANNDEIKKILTKSYTSLENLYDKFNDFSETK